MSLFDSLFPELKESAAGRALEGMTKFSEGNKAAYQRGFEEGYERAVQDLVPKIEKVSSVFHEEIESDRVKTLEKTAHLRGQATIHACAAELLRIKVAMQQGACWSCKTSKINPNSPYSRCEGCDTNSPTHN